MLDAPRRLLRRYEAFLRIEAAGGPWDVMRARATYTVAWVFALLQGANLLIMTYSYGGWTSDHTVSLTAALAVIVCVSALRWNKNFALYAAAFVVIAIGSLLAASVPAGTGINSALLPFLIIGPVIVAFIQGWRAAVLLFVFSVVVLTGLYAVTTQSGGEGVSLGPVRDFQRYAQAVLALAFCTAVSGLLAANTRAAVESSVRAAARAQAAEAAKSAFLATMSHELRTPLNGVIGLASALSDSGLGTREKQLSDTIKASGETLLVLLGDILDLSKIEAGKLDIEPRVFSPSALAVSLIDGWQAFAGEKGLTVRANIDPCLPPFLQADDLRIRQILNNLLSNAVKFTAFGEVSLTLGVRAEEEGGLYLDARVEDTGIGVPPEQAERIFLPFEQGEGGVTRRYGGTGLGLAICAKLAERMGGTVRLVPKAGPGAAFLLSVPVTRARRPAAGKDGPPAPFHGAIDGLRILAAEDNPVNRMVLSEFLRAEGVDHVIVEDGQACLEALTAHRERAAFDVLLLDRHMPVMGGEEVVRILRGEGGPFADMPVVAVTADAMAGEREHLLAAGMYDFVSKPVKPAALREAILRAIAKRRQFEAAG